MNARPFALAAALLISIFAVAQDKDKHKDLPPGSPQLIQPEDLAKALQAAGRPKPVVLYVGPHILFVHAHIPGAEYIGQTNKPDGLDKLRARAKTLPQDAFVVIYCGCCPWDFCPNIRPAYRELEKMGFTHLRVLYLPANFGTNWTEKGYAVAKGE